jgi:hypothetical protein
MLWTPVEHAGTLFLRQLGHVSLTYAKETKIIDGLRHSRQSNLQDGHLNQ